MAESTLSLTHTDFSLAVAHFLGFGLTAGNWSADQLTIIDMVIQSGLRQFYYPPKIDGQSEPYQWTFLRPVGSLTTIATFSTGTVAISNGATTMTITTGTWPSWTATHGTLTINSVEYPIASRTDDNNIELVSAWTLDTITAEELTLTHNGNYDMDDDFGGIQGTLTYGPLDNRDDIKIVGENNIRTMRSTTTTRAAPRYVAFRPKETTGVTGQRFEAQFSPIPDDAYPLEFRFTAFIHKLDATNKFPYGGMTHGETIKQSILAAAEAQEDDEPNGPRYQKFIVLLTASIGEDSKATTKRYFGQNLDRSGMHPETLTRSSLRHIANQTVTYPTSTRS